MTKADFAAYGITLKLQDGDVVLNAAPPLTIFPSGKFITFGINLPSGQIANGNGIPWQPPSLADANAPNNSIYYSTTAGKLVYKASDSSVHALY